MWQHYLQPQSLPGALTLLAATGVSPHVRAQGAAPVEQAHKPKLTRPPELTKFVQAEYPESEKAAGKGAAVVLQIAISATGVVDDVKVRNGTVTTLRSFAVENGKPGVRNA